MIRRLILFVLLFLGFGVGIFLVTKCAKRPISALSFKIGQPIDGIGGVIVYYNGPVSNVSGRNISKDKYNIGLKYQCVEFVKRYYFQHLNHKMPDASGHSKDFFDKSLGDSMFNKRRNLVQYTNKSISKPKVGDLLIFNGNRFNRFGHVAIVSKTGNSFIEIIQQNTGVLGSSREYVNLIINEEKCYINNKRVLGWLRKQ